VIFVLAGAKPVSMRYDRALMSIGCPSMRWFLGLFLCRLVPVRRWLQTFILWLSGLLSVGLRQWNHLLNWYRFFGNLLCQLLLRSISFTDSWGESLWLRRPFGCCQPLLLRQHLGFRRRPILFKLSSVWFAVGRLVSLQWLELSQTCLRWDRSRSIRFLPRWISCSSELETGHCWGPSDVFWGGFLLFTERSRCWRVSFRTCLWYRRWLNRSITSGFCPHCLYEAKGSDSLQIAGSSPDFLLGGHRLQRYAH